MPGDFLFDPLPYDPADRASCLRHARRLQDAGSLREAIHDCVPLEHQAEVFEKVGAILRAGGKGVLGNAIEAGHFYYRPNSSAEPDLEWAELKCTGLLPDGDGGHRAKERLVICMINYGGDPDSNIPCVVEETAETSHAFKKLLSILLVFYDYVKVGSPEEFLDLPIRLVDTWSPSTEDLVQFKQDWEIIQGYVKEGKAHELSEGLTPMLGACTKSSDSSVRVRQGFSGELAKPRAFSLKQAYVTQMYNSIVQRHDEKKLVNSEQTYPTEIMNSLAHIEKSIIRRMHMEIGLSTNEICDKHKITGNFGGKGSHSARMNKFANKIATGNQDVPVKSLPAFSKIGLTVRVVRVHDNGRPAEPVSFPAFDYEEVANESSWEDSSLYQDLVKRFMFIFLRDPDDGLLPMLDKVVFWSMSELYLNQTEEVWRDTVSCIQENRLDECPREKETFAVHVRPHDRCRYPGFKRSYWLNKKFIEKIWRGEA